MGNRSWFSFYTELSKNVIASGARNTLKVVRIANLLYYFINDSFCYYSEIESIGSGKYFGFLVPPKATLYIDNFIVSQKSILDSSPLNSKCTLPLEIISVDSINILN